jgi:hypothetical protein
MNAIKSDERNEGDGETRQSESVRFDPDELKAHDRALLLDFLDHIGKNEGIQLCEEHPQAKSKWPTMHTPFVPTELSPECLVEKYLLTRAHKTVPGREAK